MTKPLNNYEGFEIVQPPRRRADVHSFQRRAKWFLYDNPMSFLFIDLGMGKTIICLSLLRDMMDLGWTGKALVVAPLRVAKATWPDEIKEWEHLQDIDYTLIRAEDNDDDIKAAYDAVYKPLYEKHRYYGEPPADAARFSRKPAQKARADAKEALRCSQALEDTQLHIINIERLEWLVEFWRKRWHTHRERWPYDTLIIDEATKFGIHDTLRFRALKKVRSRLKRIYELTASPASEGYMKLFAMTYILDGGERFGRFITHYRERHFSQNPYTKAWTLKRGHDEKIAEKIADITMRLDSNDYRHDLGDSSDWLPLKRGIKLSKKSHGRVLAI